MPVGGMCRLQSGVGGRGARLNFLEDFRGLQETVLKQ